MNFENFATIPIAQLVAEAILILGSFFGYSILCILLNGKSREIRSLLYDFGPINPTNRKWLDFFQRRTIDNSWGLTLGKVVILEQTTLLTIIGAMSTIIALYAQFKSVDPSKAVFNGLNYKELLTGTT
uniref:Uncharacterized protein n=1 Tax=Plectus sambesii TaxID=2011161 RepID=A0A914VCQ8_9BILA